MLIYLTAGNIYGQLKTGERYAGIVKESVALANTACDASWNQRDKTGNNTLDVLLDKVYKKNASNPLAVAALEQVAAACKVEPEMYFEQDGSLIVETFKTMVLTKFTNIAGADITDITYL